MTETNTPPAADPNSPSSPSSPSSIEQDSIETEIKRASALIVAARRLLSEDGIVDLAPIEGTVEALCWKVRDISPGHRAPVLLALENMIDNLDRLADELTGQNRTIAARFETTSPLDAIAAYTKPGDRS